MSKVDWSLAPEGATHWTPADVCNPFLKFEDGKWYWFCGAWLAYGEDDGWMSLQLSGIISKPEEKQPRSWSGPEDGLPPIGSTVYIFDEEPHVCYADHVGSDVEIIAHSESGSGNETAVYRIKDYDGEYNYHALIADCFRPLPNAKQTAISARESAIRDIMDIAQVDCRVTAARLVDAGFKREVV